MKFIGATITNLEEAAISETKGKKFSKGRIEFEDYSEDSPYFTLETIYELISSSKIGELSKIIEEIKKAEISIVGTYKCLCNREGEHNFTSMMVEMEAGKTIGELNEGAEYSRENPETIVFFDIKDDQLNIGILKRRNNSHRDYRFKLNNQTTPPLLASSLIKYLGVNNEDSLLVLDCKDGVIPIEAKLQGIGDVKAQDSNPNNIRNAKINAKLAKVDLEFCQKSIEQLSDLSVDFMISTLVFSKNKRGPHKKMNDIFQLSESILKKELAILTNHPDDVLIFKPDEIVLKTKKEIAHKGLKLTLLVFTSN